MVKKFLFLEWKSFSRSASFNFNLAIKILLSLAAAFYGVMILFLGIGAFYALQEEGFEPLSTVNKYLVYWWLADFIVRYFLQQSPIMHVKLLLTLPIKKGKIVSFLLGKSAFSFFNIYPIFFFIPFSIVLIVNGYSIIGVIAWHVAIMSIVYANNYLNLLIDNLNALFIVVALILVGLIGAQYAGYLDITIYFNPIFQAFYAYPMIGYGMLLIPILLFLYSYNFFKLRLRLDDAVKKKEKEVKTENFTWLDKYGVLGSFLKNDIKLITRNKRSKSTVITSVLFLFYGILLMSNSSYNEPTWKLFAGLFVSGGFLFTFGGFVPSWDSSYYPLMMSQNIKYKEYLSSKWWLIVIATFCSMLLASFYLFFGWDYYLAIIVGAIYNMGVNAHIVLLGGAYVKTPIDLSSGKKAFGDKKAFNVKTILITIPKLLLPLLIFYVFYKIWNIQAGYIAVALLGIIGFAFKNKVFSLIEKIYKQEKYATLSAYKQKN